MSKHRKIAIALHVGNGLLLVGLGLIVFVLAQAFVGCSSAAIRADPTPCTIALAIFLGIPAGVALLPIVALLTFGRIARGFLWVYAVMTAVLFIPFGTAVGAHTIYLLRSSAERATLT